MDKPIRDVAYLMSFSIEHYMNEKGIDEEQAIRIFSENNMSHYILFGKSI